MQKSFVILLRISVCVTLLSALSFAQVLYGTLVGTAEDASSALIPNAEVTIRNDGTGFTRSTKTGSDGAFSLLNILPGVYSVKVSANGFKSINISNVEVLANNVSRLTAKLEVGTVTDTVTVEASTAQLQTEKAETKSEISQKAVQTLPLNIYRNYQALINLVPGATPANFQNSATDTPGRSLTTNINGTARNNNNTRIDGALSVNVWLPHHTAYTPPSESIDAVNVTTGSMDAEQGMAGGAAVTVVTASGSNEMHGAGWWYHNNQHLRARNFFLSPTQNKPRDTNNIFGAKLGGAIIKNKLFYFGHYEATRQRVGNNGIFSVPTATARAGNYSANIAANGAGTIYDPATGTSPATRMPFAGNTIPSSRISAISNRILQLVPAPNLAGELNNFAAGATGVFDRDNYDVKMNYNHSETLTIWGKYSRFDANVTGSGAFGQLVGPAVVQDPGTGDTKVQTPSFGMTKIFSPTLLMDATFGASILDQTVQAVDFGVNWGLERFGIPGTNGSDPRQSGLPAFNFTGYSSYGLTQTWMPLFRNDRSFTFSTNFTKTYQKHEVRFGYDVVQHRLNHWQPEIANPRGNFDFGGAVTASGATGAPSPNNFNSFAAFLLGSPTLMSKSLQYLLLTGREWQNGLYVRDRWQVTRNLTVNLGMRYEYYPLMTRADGKGIERLDLNTNRVFLGGYGSTPRDAGISVSRGLWAPRIGIAWRMKDTVLRTGYGLTYDPLPFSRPLRGFYPLTIAQTTNAENFLPAGNLATGIPTFGGPDLSSGSVNLPPNVDMRTPGNKINRGYIQSWNLSLERNVGFKTIVSVGYVGTQTTNQLADLNLNTAGPNTLNADLPFARAFGRTIALNYWDGFLSSNYHSLQVAINRNFSNGLFLKGAYTYSRAMNMTDEDGWASVNYNWGPAFRRNYARAGYDRPQVFQMAAIYEMPFGKGKKFANSNRVASAVLGGWQLNSVFYHFSGTPFSVTADGSLLRSPANLQTANQLTGTVTKLGGIGQAFPYFDPTNFAAPTQAGQFGNMGRNALRGPGVTGMDGGIFRSFPLTEKTKLEFRAEAFNLTNTPRFNNPAANASVTGNFMRIVSTRFDSDRQFRFGMKLAF
jgi:hypothetical protein